MEIVNPVSEEENELSDVEAEMSTGGLVRQAAVSAGVTLRRKEGVINAPRAKRTRGEANYTFLY